MNAFLTPPVYGNTDHSVLSLNEPYLGEYSIYISVPFCVGKCRSCPFYKTSVPQVNLKQEINKYIKVIKSRISQLAYFDRYKRAKCTAIYLGGGTASLLDFNIVNDLIQFLRQHFILDANCEITLEGNPIDFTSEYLGNITQVTRVSIGLQSLEENTLKIIGTRHNAEQSNNIIQRKFDTFKIINIDFIYAIMDSESPKTEHLLKVINQGFNSITLYRYDSATHSVDKQKAWESYLKYKEILTTHNFKEKMFGFFTKNYINIYNENLINAKEMIGFGPGSYGFINDYMIKFKNDYEAYLGACCFITHRSNHPNKQMRLDVFNILCHPDINLRSRIAARMGITEKLEGYPYF